MPTITPTTMQRQVLRDALTEFIVARAGHLVFEPDCNLAEATAPYIHRRYMFHDDAFMDRKHKEVMVRVQTAMDLLRSI